MATHSYFYTSCKKSSILHLDFICTRINIKGVYTNILVYHFCPLKIYEKPKKLAFIWPHAPPRNQACPIFLQCHNTFSTIQSHNILTNFTLGYPDYMDSLTISTVVRARNSNYSNHVQHKFTSRLNDFGPRVFNRRPLTSHTNTITRTPDRLFSRITIRVQTTPPVSTPCVCIANTHTR